MLVLREVSNTTYGMSELSRSQVIKVITCQIKQFHLEQVQQETPAIKLLRLLLLELWQTPINGSLSTALDGHLTKFPMENYCQWGRPSEQHPLRFIGGSKK